MPWINCITLPNPGPVISTTIKVNYTEHEYGYDIDSVDVYHDAACKQLLTDCCVDELPSEAQDRIYSAIDNKRHQLRRERGLRRLKADLEADAYAARLMGARA